MEFLKQLSLKIRFLDIELYITSRELLWGINYYMYVIVEEFDYGTASL